LTNVSKHGIVTNVKKSIGVFDVYICKNKVVIFLASALFVLTLSFIPLEAKEQEFAPLVLSEFQKSELWWHAAGIYFEARNQSVKGQLRVAEVILFRRNDPRWPDTIQGVIRQGEKKLNRCQFSFMCDGNPKHISKRINYKSNAWVQAYDFAYYYLIRETRNIKIESCAIAYHADYATNVKWFAKLTLDDQVGTHIFYCD